MSWLNPDDPKNQTGATNDIGGTAAPQLPGVAAGTNGKSDPNFLAGFLDGLLGVASGPGQRAGIEAPAPAAPGPSNYQQTYDQLYQEALATQATRESTVPGTPALIGTAPQTPAAPVTPTGWVNLGNNHWVFYSPTGQPLMHDLRDENGKPIPASANPSMYAAIFPNAPGSQAQAEADAKGPAALTSPDFQLDPATGQIVPVLQPQGPTMNMDQLYNGQANLSDNTQVDYAYVNTVKLQQVNGIPQVSYETWRTLSPAARLSVEQQARAAQYSRNQTGIAADIAQNKQVFGGLPDPVSPGKQAEAAAKQELPGAELLYEQAQQNTLAAAQAYQADPTNLQLQQNLIEANAAEQARGEQMTMLQMNASFSEAKDPIQLLMMMMDAPRGAVATYFGGVMYDIANGGDGGWLGQMLVTAAEGARVGTTAAIAGIEILTQLIAMFLGDAVASGLRPDFLDDFSGTPAELVMAMVDWASNPANKTTINAAHGAYGEFNGDRGVWEFFQSGRSGWERFTSDVYMDPFTYTPIGKAAGVRVIGRAAESTNPVLRIGGQAVGGALAAPDVAGNWAVDKVFEGVGGLATYGISSIGMGKLVDASAKTELAAAAIETTNAAMAANQAANTAIGGGAVTPPGQPLPNNPAGGGPATNANVILPSTNPQTPAAPVNPAAQGSPPPASNAQTNSPGPNSAGTASNANTNPASSAATAQVTPVTPTTPQTTGPVPAGVVPPHYATSTGGVPVAGYTTLPGEETFGAYLDPTPGSGSTATVRAVDGTEKAAYVERSPGGQTRVYYVTKDGAPVVASFPNPGQAADYVADYLPVMADGTFDELYPGGIFGRNNVNNASVPDSVLAHTEQLAKAHDEAIRRQALANDPLNPTDPLDPQAAAGSPPTPPTPPPTTGPGATQLITTPTPTSPVVSAPGSGPTWATGTQLQVQTNAGATVIKGTTSDGTPQLSYAADDGTIVKLEYAPNDNPTAPYLITVSNQDGILTGERWVGTEADGMSHFDSAIVSAEQGAAVTEATPQVIAEAAVDELIDRSGQDAPSLVPKQAAFAPKLIAGAQQGDTFFEPTRPDRIWTAHRDSGGLWFEAQDGNVMLVAYHAEEPGGGVKQWFVARIDPRAPDVTQAMTLPNALQQVDELVKFQGMEDHIGLNAKSSAFGALPAKWQARVKEITGTADRQANDHSGRWVRSDPPNAPGVTNTMTSQLDELPDPVTEAVVASQETPTTAIPGEDQERIVEPPEPPNPIVADALSQAATDPASSGAVVDALAPDPVPPRIIVNPLSGEETIIPGDLSPQGEVAFQQLVRAAEHDPAAATIVSAISPRVDDQANQTQAVQATRDAYNASTKQESELIAAAETGVPPEVVSDIEVQQSTTMNGIETHIEENVPDASTAVSAATANKTDMRSRAARAIDELAPSKKGEFRQASDAHDAEYLRVAGKAFKKDNRELSAPAVVIRSIANWRRNLAFARTVEDLTGTKIPWVNPGTTLENATAKVNRYSLIHQVQIVLLGNEQQADVALNNAKQILLRQPDADPELIDKIIYDLDQLRVAAHNNSAPPAESAPLPDNILNRPRNVQESIKANVHKGFPAELQPVVISNQEIVLGLSDITINLSGAQPTVTYLGRDGRMIEPLAFDTVDQAINHARLASWARQGEGFQTVRVPGQPVEIHFKGQDTGFVVLKEDGQTYLAKKNGNTGYSGRRRLPKNEVERYGTIVQRTRPRSTSTTISGFIDNAGTVDFDQADRILNELYTNENIGLFSKIDNHPHLKKQLTDGRGLTEEEIEQIGFKVLPAHKFKERRDMLGKIKHIFGKDQKLWFEAKGELESPTLLGNSYGEAAIALPIRDADDRILGYTYANPDTFSTKSKYRQWATGDTAALVHVHNQNLPTTPGRVWIVNGHFKAAYAGAKTGDVVIGLQGDKGLGNLAAELAKLQQLPNGVSEIIIAFDADAISRSARDATEKYVRQIPGPWRLGRADWQPGVAKGLDDAVDSMSVAAPIKIAWDGWTVPDTLVNYGSPRNGSAPRTRAQDTARRAQAPTARPGRPDGEIEHTPPPSKSARVGRVQDELAGVTVYIGRWPGYNGKRARATGPAQQVKEMASFQEAAHRFRFDLDGTEVAVPDAFGNPFQVGTKLTDDQQLAQREARPVGYAGAEGEELTDTLTATQAVARYEPYLEANPELMRKLPQLRGTNIVCYCKSPNGTAVCHGDVLVRLLEKYSDDQLRTWTARGIPEEVREHQLTWAAKKRKGAEDYLRITEQEREAAAAAQRKASLERAKTRGVKVHERLEVTGEGELLANGKPIIAIHPKINASNQKLQVYVTAGMQELSNVTAHIDNLDTLADTVGNAKARAVNAANQRGERMSDWATLPSIILEIDPNNAWARSALVADELMTGVLGMPDIQMARQIASAKAPMIRAKDVEAAGTISGDDYLDSDFMDVEFGADQAEKWEALFKVRANLFDQLRDMWHKKYPDSNPPTIKELSQFRYDAADMPAPVPGEPTPRVPKDIQRLLAENSAQMKSMSLSNPKYKHGVSGISKIANATTYAKTAERFALADAEVRTMQQDIVAWLNTDLIGPHQQDKAELQLLKMKNHVTRTPAETERMEALITRVSLNEQKLKHVLDAATSENRESLLRRDWFRRSKSGAGYKRLKGEIGKGDTITDAASRGEAARRMEELMGAINRREQALLHLSTFHDSRLDEVLNIADATAKAEDDVAAAMDEVLTLQIQTERENLARAAQSGDPMGTLLHEAGEAPLPRTEGRIVGDKGRVEKGQIAEALLPVKDARVHVVPNPLGGTEQAWHIQVEGSAPYTGELYIIGGYSKDVVWIRTDNPTPVPIGKFTALQVGENYETAAGVAQLLDGIWRAGEADQLSLDESLIQVALDPPPQQLGGVGVGLPMAAASGGAGIVDQAAQLLGGLDISLPQGIGMAVAGAATIAAGKRLRAAIKAKLKPAIRIRSGLRDAVTADQKFVEAAIARGSIDRSVIPLTARHHDLLNRQIQIKNGRTVKDIINRRLQYQYGTNLGTASTEQVMAQYDYIKYLLAEEFGWNKPERAWLQAYDAVRSAYAEFTLLMPWSLPRQLLSNTFLGNFNQLVLGGEGAALKHLNLADSAALARYAFHADRLYTSENTQWIERMFGGLNMQLTGVVQTTALMGQMNPTGSIISKIVKKVPLGPANFLKKPVNWWLETAPNLVNAVEWSFRMAVYHFHARNGVVNAWRDWSIALATTLSTTNHAIPGAGAAVGLAQNDVARILDGFVEIPNPAELQVAIGNILADFGVPKAAAHKHATELAEEWATRLGDVDADAMKHVDSVLFPYRETNADEILKRIAPFHFYMTRSYPFYIKNLLRHPAGMANFYRAASAIQRDAKEKNWPGFMQKYLSIFSGPAGLFLAVNPIAALGIFDVILQTEGGIERNRTLVERFLDFSRENTGIGPYSWFLAPLAYAGYMGSSTFYLDPVGTSSMRSFLGGFVQLMATRGWLTGDSPVVFGQPFNSLLTEIRDITSGRLPGSTHYEATDLMPNEMIRNILLDNMLTTEGVSYADFYTGLIDLQAQRDTPAARQSQFILNSVMLEYDNESAMYDEAVRQYSEWYVAGRLVNTTIGGGVAFGSQPGYDQEAMETEGMAAVGLDTAPKIPAGKTSDEKVANAMGDPEFAQDWEDSFPDTPMNEQTVAAYIDVTKGASTVADLPAPSAQLIMDTNAYFAIGDANTQYHYGNWAGILFGTLEATAVTINGRVYMADDINAMSEEQRKILASHYWANHDQDGSLTKLRADREAFRASHPEFNAYDMWKKEMKDAWEEVGGVREYRRRLMEMNPGAKDHFAALRKEIQHDNPNISAVQLEAALDEKTFSIETYMAILGLPRYDGQETKGKGQGLDLLPPGYAARAANDAGSGTAWNGNKSVTGADVRQAVSDTLAATAGAEQYLEDQFGEPVDYSALPPPVRAWADNALMAGGYYMPENAWMAEEYLAWQYQQQGLGRTDSPEAFAQAYNAGLAGSRNDSFTPMPGGWGFSGDLQGVGDPSQFPAGAGPFPSDPNAQFLGQGLPDDPAVLQQLLEQMLASGELDPALLEQYGIRVPGAVP